MALVMGFDHVSKQYRLGAHRTDLRELISRTLGGRQPDSDGPDVLWALKDVSFEAHTGDVLGLIGHNGAGKTTALKLLSGVTHPTSGCIQTHGRVAALIELGAGFHPDLTGRENVYLNGVILGLTRKQIDQRFQQIVDFAELERFIDTPVKRYSSGMYARLGFSVAAHTDPDMLVVDEVLGVGDAQFQRKCYDFIHRLVSGTHKTAMFVSHNLYVVEQLCSRLVWLDSGHVMKCGTPGEVLPAYFEHMEQRALASVVEVVDGHGLQVASISFTDGEGRNRSVFTTGEDIVVKLRYKAPRPIERPHFALGVVGSGNSQPLFTASMLVDGGAPSSIVGDGIMTCRFASVPLMPRVYDVWGEVWGADRAQAIVRWQKFGSFGIVENHDSASAVGAGAVSRLRSDAPIRVAYQWQY